MVRSLYNDLSNVKRAGDWRRTCLFLSKDFIDFSPKQAFSQNFVRRKHLQSPTLLVFSNLLSISIYTQNLEI